MTPAENSMNAIDSIDEIVDKDHKNMVEGIAYIILSS